ncbi:tripartite motif-containing protein 52-like [Alligator mississippiensis]|uniref:RING-type E3 ubiquitin transferase n=1 Tax=Alligator mississippiensis TaxID=8496 RepID=A0A151MUM6_ALLMI|nr:tripartite motif-containing protein 52-like [Alligator mississippiensis]
MECPICRGQIQKKHFRPNWDLANIVGKVRQWDSSRSSVEEAEVNLCVKHKKSLDLFCEEDREAVCVVCERSPEHSSHTVLLLEEAAQKCKEQIQTHLQTLKGEREKLKEFQVRGERESQEWMDFRSTLTRCEKAKLQQLVGVSPELEKRVVNSYRINKALKETLKTFKGTEEGEGRHVSVTAGEEEL